MTIVALLLVVLLGEIVALFLSLDQKGTRPIICFSLVAIVMSISTTGYFFYIILFAPFVFMITVIFALPVKRRGFAPGLIWALLLLTGFYSAWYGILMLKAISPADILQDTVLICGLLLIPTVYLALRGRLLSRAAVFNFVVYFGFTLTIYCVVATLLISGPKGVISGRIGAVAEYNPNLLASFLDLSVPLALWKARTGNRNRLNWVVFGTQFLGLLMTGTRGSFPTIAISIGVILWGFRHSSRAFFSSLFLTTVAVLVFASVAIERIIHPSINELASNWDRLKLAEASRNVLKQNNYIWGVGFNTFYKIKYHFGFPYWGDKGSGFSSHNAHLEIYLGWGILGIIGWLGMFLRQLIKHAWQWWGHRVYNRSAAIGVSVGCFFLHGIVESTIGHPPFVWILSSLLGLSFFQTEGECVALP